MPAILLALVILGLIGCASTAQQAAVYGQQTTVAVLPSDGTVIDNDELEALTDIMREAALKVLPTNTFVLLKQDVVVKRLGGAENYIKECRESSCIVDLGKKAQVDYVAQASVMKLGNRIRLKVELYNVRTEGLVGMLNDEAEDIRGLLEIVKKKAPEVFKQILDVSGGSTVSFSVEGIEAYYDKGDYDRVIEECSAALRIKPDLHEALKWRGNAYAKKGNYDRAIEDYNATLRIKPDYQALYNRGSAYAEKGNYDRAIEDFTAAIKIKPDFQAALFYRGVAYGIKGNADRAIEDFKAAVRIDPNSTYANYVKQLLEEARKIKK